MVALALGALLSMQVPCAPAAAALVETATARAAEFDLAGAADQLEAAVARGCASAAVAAVYVRGLVDAREAFRQGAPPESLVPIRQAMTELERVGQGRLGPAEIARLMLHAAAASAQGERDEMRLYLESAVRMESLQRAAGQPGAPVVAAAEVAGDLWLQLYRYEEARRSYTDASAQVGPTARVTAGLARVAARLNDTASACAEFERLVQMWGSRPALPAEVVEARAYLDQAACGARTQP